MDMPPREPGPAAPSFPPALPRPPGLPHLPPHGATNLPPAACNRFRRESGSGGKTSGSTKAAGPWGRSRGGHSARTR